MGPTDFMRQKLTSPPLFLPYSCKSIKNANFDEIISKIWWRDHYFAIFRWKSKALMIGVKIPPSFVPISKFLHRKLWSGIRVRKVCKYTGEFSWDRPYLIGTLYLLAKRDYNLYPWLKILKFESAIVMIDWNIYICRRLTVCLTDRFYRCCGP